MNKALQTFLVLVSFLTKTTPAHKPVDRFPPEKRVKDLGFVVRFPFVYNDGLIALKARVNGKKKGYTFILDSGAPTFITGTLARENELQTWSSETAIDADGNRVSVDMYRLQNLEIGGRKFEHVQAAWSEALKEMPVLKGRADGGLIGADLMRNSIWMIDYTHREITITDRIDTLSIPDYAYPTRLYRNENGSPLIRVAIQKTKALIL